MGKKKQSKRGFQPKRVPKKTLKKYVPPAEKPLLDYHKKTRKRSK